jgi:hypothetical protein
MNDQRDVQQLLILRMPMANIESARTVLAEFFAMIRGDYDHCVTQQVLVFQEPE